MSLKLHCTGYVLRSYQIRLCQEGLKKLRNCWTSISGDSALVHVTLLICLAVELLLVPWLINTAFGGRAPIGYVSLQISGLFGGVPAIIWKRRYTGKAWKLCAWLLGNKLKLAQCHWSWTLQLFKQALGSNVSCHLFSNKLQVWWDRPQNWFLNNSRTINRHDAVDKNCSRSSFQPWNTAAL